MVATFFPAGGPSVSNGFSNWREMGTWYWNLERGRSDASPEIKQEVAALTAGKTTSLQKMQALAQFVQRDIRYVAIELGIGGWQPHPATEVFSHRYGDCKDKATLMRSMLQEIGVDSYQVAINTARGSITPGTPAYRGFDHQIIGIRLPDEVKDLIVDCHMARCQAGYYFVLRSNERIHSLRADSRISSGKLRTTDHS